MNEKNRTFFILFVVFIAFIAFIVGTLIIDNQNKIEELEQQITVLEEETEAVKAEKTELQTQYDEMEYYYMRDFAFDFVSGMTYEFGRILTKRDDITVFKYLFEYGEDNERKYIYSQQDVPFEYDVVLVYDEFGNLFAIVGR